MAKGKNKKIEKLNLESVNGNFAAIQEKVNELVKAYNGESEEDSAE